MKIHGMLLTGILFGSSILTGTSNAAMPGSYVGADLTDQRVVDAANFAVEKIKDGSLDTIVSAEQQVVAGMNYDLVLQLNAPGGTKKIYEVVVFVPLSDEPMQLKSVTKLEN